MIAGILLLISVVMTALFILAGYIFLLYLVPCDIENIKRKNLKKGES